MKTINTVTAMCCIGFVTFAGDTNFVAQFNSVWKTHNASNVLVFVEQNITTNKSPETLFARGIVAVFLQEWSQGATNYWEESMQMITTNTVYSETGKTNATKKNPTYPADVFGIN